MKKYLLLLVIGTLTFGTSCKKDPVQPEKFPAADFIKTGTYSGAYFPTSSWRECSPEEVGMNSEVLKDMNDTIAELVELDYEIHSVLVIRYGYIVAEQYYSRYFDKDTEHIIHSCTKSFTSALVGIAIREGYIQGISDKMLDYFRDYQVENISPQKESITLEHMLTMSAGLDWNELDYLYSDPRNTHYQWKRSEDWIQFVLDRPMEYPPGSVQDYNSGLSELLAAIIQEATGMRADSFAMEHLLGPLGINEFYWPANPQGYARGGGGMRLTPRDMAKLGYLHIQKGKWESEQLLSEEWIIASGHKHIVSQHIPGFWYGYQFWVMEDGMMYTALGYAGQWIMIVPEYDLVVVFTNYFDEGVSEQEGTPVRLFYDYIVPAIMDK